MSKSDTFLGLGFSITHWTLDWAWAWAFHDPTLPWVYFKLHQLCCVYNYRERAEGGSRDRREDREVCDRTNHRSEFCIASIGIGVYHRSNCAFPVADWRRSTRISKPEGRMLPTSSKGRMPSRPNPILPQYLRRIVKVLILSLFSIRILKNLFCILHIAVDLI